MVAQSITCNQSQSALTFGALRSSLRATQSNHKSTAILTHELMVVFPPLSNRLVLVSNVTSVLGITAWPMWTGRDPTLRSDRHVLTVIDTSGVHVLGEPECPGCHARLQSVGLDDIVVHEVTKAELE